MGGQLISRLERDLLEVPPSVKVENPLFPLDEARTNIKQIRFNNRLMRAVKNGNKDMVMYLIKNRKNGDLDQVERGCNALNVAIHRRNLELVQVLIKAGCNLDLCGEDHKLPPLFQCVAYNLPDYVRLLIESGCDPRLESDGENSLHIAVQSLPEPQTMVDYLVEYININSQSEKDGKSILHWAIVLQRCSFLKHLIENKTRTRLNLNSRDGNGETAVQVAVRNQLWRDADLLIKGGCEVNVRDDREQPLLLSVILVKNKRGPLPTVNPVQRRLRANSSSAEYDVDIGPLEIIEGLIAAGADVNFIDPPSKRVSILHKVAEFGDEDTAEILLKAGANANITCHLGQIPLHSAANHGHDTIVQILLSKGAEIDHPDQLQRTPLHLAATRGHLPVVKMLLTHGALVDGVDDFGKSPLLVAAQAGFFEICSTLIKGGAHVDCCDKTGKGALHAAVAFPKFDIPLICLLLDSGCDPLNLDEFLGSLLELGHFRKQLMPGLYDWYMLQKRTPRTLKQLCRMTIQSKLQAKIKSQGGSSSPSGAALKRHNSLREHTAMLPLPRTLQSYLTVKMV